MSSLTWKIKQFFRKMMPIALIGAVLYGGVTMYEQGVFRRGLKPAINTMLYKLPYFGSRFKHYNRGGRSYSYKKSYRKGRRHSYRGRRARRSRRY